MPEQPLFDATLDWPFGQLGIVMAGNAVAEIRFLDGGARPTQPASPAAAVAVESLERYIRDAGTLPDLPVGGRGTPFQKRVWRELRAIPPGAVLSYGDLARKLGTSPRAIGGACRANPVPLLVPCHRVVARRGIGGFSGARGGRWLEIKRWLLAREGVEIR